MTSTADSRLEAQNLRMAYDDHIIIEDLSLRIPTAKFSVIVGPNACGKSTLLRALARLLPAKGGSVLLDGQEIQRLPTREVAQRLGILPQQPISPDGVVVSDLVARGRHPHQRWFRQWSREDEAAVNDALVATNTTNIADRSVDELSGGQRQRVWIAMALAQGTDLLLLDEPTTFLDLAHQVDVLDLLCDLNRLQGRTIVCILHDLNLASRYAHHLVAMRDGAIVAEGPPGEVVTQALVREVFDLDARVIADPVAGTPLVLPIGRHHTPPDTETRSDPNTYVATVRRVTNPSPGVRQITLAGGGLDRFAPIGPDSFVYLLLPPVGQTQLSVDASFSWESFGEMDPHGQPVGAYYTVRRWRREDAEIDLHVVLHPDPGPAADWAASAAAGDPVAIWGPRTAWAPPEGTKNYLLVADDTALPAAAAIVESLPKGASATLIAETQSPHTRPPLPPHPDVNVVWVDRGDGSPGTGTQLIDAVRAVSLTAEGAYAWGGGESRIMTTVRHHLRDERKMATDQVSLLAYWRRNAPGTDA